MTYYNIKYQYIYFLNHLLLVYLSLVIVYIYPYVYMNQRMLYKFVNTCKCIKFK